MLTSYRKPRHLAALGALVMILSLAYDPLVQNLVSYPTLYHDYSYSDPLGKAWVANTRNFEVRNWIYDVECMFILHRLFNLSTDSSPPT